MAKWGPYLLAGKDLYNAKVGIFGMGDIGKAFARRLKALMLILCTIIVADR